MRRIHRHPRICRHTHGRADSDGQRRAQGGAPGARRGKAGAWRIECWQYYIADNCTGRDRTGPDGTPLYARPLFSPRSYPFHLRLDIRGFYAE